MESGTADEKSKTIGLSIAFITEIIGLLNALYQNQWISVGVICTALVVSCIVAIFLKTKEKGNQNSEEKRYYFTKPQRITAIVILGVFVISLISFVLYGKLSHTQQVQESKYQVIILGIDGDEGFSKPTIYTLIDKLDSISTNVFSGSINSDALSNSNVNHTISIDSIANSYTNFNGLFLYGDIYNNEYTGIKEERYFVRLDKLTVSEQNFIDKEAMLHFPNSISFSQECKIDVIAKFITGYILLAENKPDSAYNTFASLQQETCTDVISNKNIDQIIKAIVASNRAISKDQDSTIKVEKEELTKPQTPSNSNASSLDVIKEGPTEETSKTISKEHIWGLDISYSSKDTIINGEKFIDISKELVKFTGKEYYKNFMETPYFYAYPKLPNKKLDAGDYILTINHPYTNGYIMIGILWNIDIEKKAKEFHTIPSENMIRFKIYTTGNYQFVPYFFKEKGSLYIGETNLYKLVKK